MRAYSLLRELVRDCGATLVDEQPRDRKARHLYALFKGEDQSLDHKSRDESRIDVPVSSPETKIFQRNL